jgi:alpha-amylase
MAKPSMGTRSAYFRHTPFADETSYRYWTQDFNSLNPHFGSDQDLRDLSTELHNRGMYLMLDIVVNHVGAPSLSDRNGFSLDSFYHPFTNAMDFHPQCFVGSSTDQHTIEQCWLGDDKLPLPDINTEDQNVVQLMYDWIHNVVQQYVVDGLRIDTAKHVRKDFWPGFMQAAGVYTIGEILSGDTDYVAPYTGAPCSPRHYHFGRPDYMPDNLIEVLDAVLDYPTYFPLFRAFTSTQATFADLVTAIQHAQASYKRGLFGTGSFVANHDLPRLPSVTHDPAVRVFLVFYAG